MRSVRALVSTEPGRQRYKPPVAHLEEVADIMDNEEVITNDESVRGRGEGGGIVKSRERFQLRTTRPIDAQNSTCCFYRNFVRYQTRLRLWPWLAMSSNLASTSQGLETAKQLVQRVIRMFYDVRQAIIIDQLVRKEA